MNEPQTLQYARMFTGWGCACIPLKHRDKLPLVKDWQHAPICDEQRLLKYFASGNNNMGIVCGLPSSNLVVIDFDEMWAWVDWVENHHLTTPTVQTRRGMHIYVRVERLPAHKCKLAIDGQLVGDVLTTGAQVVGPGSTHPTGHIYKLMDVCELATIESIDELGLPLQVVAPSTIEGARPDIPDDIPGLMPGIPDAWVNAGIKQLVVMLTMAREGNRNELLFWAACRAFDDGLQLQQVTALLESAALACGLTEREVTATIASASKTPRKTPTTPEVGPRPAQQRLHKPRSAQQRMQRRRLGR